MEYYQVNQVREIYNDSGRLFGNETFHCYLEVSYYSPLKRVLNIQPHQQITDGLKIHGVLSSSIDVHENRHGKKGAGYFKE